MKLLNKLVVAGCALFTSFSVFSAKTTTPPPINPVDAIVNETMAGFMLRNQIPGATVQLYLNGKPYSYYFGYANRDSRMPVTKNTIFEIGSITKVMTGILLAQQLDAAKVKLDDSVTDYLPALPDTFNKITLKNLATHTGGLPFNRPASVTNAAQLGQFLDQWKPKYLPGQQWIYSNISIGLLGAAIEASSNKTGDQLYRTQILAPLNMQPIALTVPKKLEAYYAQGYDKSGKPMPRISMPLFQMAGAMKASASDMQRFLSAAIGLPGTPERVFYPMRMTQAAYAQLADRDQGLGWQTHIITPDKLSHLLNEPDTMTLGPIPVVKIYDQPTYNGDELIDKTGATDGFRAYIAVIPNKKSGIVIMTNKYIENGQLVNTARHLLFQLTGVMQDAEKQKQAMKEKD